MAKNTKTPVMILQELTVKKNTVPEYELIYSQQGTHENLFHYKVTVLKESAIGIGRSKKEAKHEAASKALELLAGKGIVHPDVSDDYVQNREVYQDHALTKPPLNCIPKLLDICVENRIPLAEFIEISAVGPPHCREFTYECHIASIITRATAGSKKHAKQIAAKDMLNRIMNMIPELQQQVDSDQLKLTDQDQETLEKYNSLSKFAPPKLNFNIRVTEYHLQFKKLMDEFNIAKEKVLEFFELPPSKDVLAELLNLFDLNFESEILQEEPLMVVFTVHTDSPVAVIETGCSLEVANAKALNQIFVILKSLCS